jgi:hypothetical protein
MLCLTGVGVEKIVQAGRRRQQVQKEDESNQQTAERQLAPSSPIFILALQSDGKLAQAGTDASRRINPRQPFFTEAKSMFYDRLMPTG